MSRSKTELSVTERLIIQLVIYRTKNPKHPTFFGDNKNIAKCIDVQPDTVRKAIAKLVKLEYLQLGYDKQGRRHLVYTGKVFAPIVENMNNIDKKSLRDDKEYYEREAQNATHELKLAQIRIETLERENTLLRNELFQAKLRISQLESLFTAQGCTKEQINAMIKQMSDMQMAA
jgi:DNA-binding MarR family transcriptional regulator